MKSWIILLLDSYFEVVRTSHIFYIVDAVKYFLDLIESFYMTGRKQGKVLL